MPDMNRPKFCVRKHLLCILCVVYLATVSSSCYEALNYWIVVNNERGSAGSNPTGGMDVSSECCVLSGRGLGDELVTRPEESYRL
jgi:hypothetical protein